MPHYYGQITAFSGNVDNWEAYVYQTVRELFHGK